jgi:hypothetical protein
MLDYLSKYIDIIEKARSENRVKYQGIYYENHHIWPNCWCKGELEYLVKDPINLVLLTANEHFLVHYYLFKMFPNDKSTIHALWRMCNQQNEFRKEGYVVDKDALIYEEAKEAKVKVMKSESNPGKNKTQNTKDKISKSLKGRKTWNKGKIGCYSEETLEKMSVSKKDIKLSEEHKESLCGAKKEYYENGGVAPMQDKKHTEDSIEKMSEIKKGHHVSDETKRKMSEKKKGKKRPTIICPICNKEGGVNNMSRYHFDNCKYKVAA